MGQSEPTGAEPREARDQPARLLAADEAANFLDISPATLRVWEQNFGFPSTVMSNEPAPKYLTSHLLALQDALAEALSITSAIHTARRTIGGGGASDA